MPVHPPARNYAETLKEDREAFILADRLGYSEGYCGEHLTDQAENIPNSMMFIATLMGATSQIKLGTAVVNLPHSHPVVVASNAAMLDNLLEGRFILGVGAGVLRSDAEALGMLDADRNAMFAEAIDQIARAVGGHGADRPQGQVLDDLDAEDDLARGRHRRHRQALPEAASADRRHRHRPGVQRADRARAARLVADLLALPASQLAQEPVGQLRQGLRRGRPQGRSRQLAGRALDLRGRGRQGRDRVWRRRSEQSLPVLHEPADREAAQGKTHDRLQGQPRDGRRGRSPSTTSSTTS